MDTRLDGIGAFSGTEPGFVVNSGCNIPLNASAAVVNATVIPAASLGHLTLWPQGTTQPATSTLNATDGNVTNNLAITGLSAGAISAFASNPTQLILDLSGYFTAEPSAPPPNAITGPSSAYSNLGPIPFDDYNNTTPASKDFPSCPSGSTVRSCLVSQLNQLAGQHVSVVRFQFAFCGGGNSTALTGCGTYNPPYALHAGWLTNVNAFFADIMAAGIHNIIITPEHLGYGGEPINTGARANATSPGGQLCSDTPDPVIYWPAAPYGTKNVCDVNGMNCNNTFPIGQDQNAGYNCAPKNPYFIGWQNMYNVLYAMLDAAVTNALTVTEIDNEQELNMLDFTVQLRYFVDNAHADTGYVSGNTFADTYMALQSALKAHNRNSYRVNSSTQTIHASSTSETQTYNCYDVYGDYARFMLLDQVEQAIFGGVIGVPSGATIGPIDQLVCGGTTSGMFPAPVSHILPDIIDIHAYPCLDAGTPCTSVSSEATVDFNDVARVRSAAQQQGARLIVGETHSVTVNGVVNCEGAPVTAPADTVTGYNASTAAGLPVIFEPWFYMFSSCYGYPIKVNPPYVPTNY